MAISRISQSTVQAGFPKFNNTWDGFSAVGSMELIKATTLSASSASVEFNNIPGTYSHLQLRWMGRGTFNEGSAGQKVNFNSDTTSSYTGHLLRGNGSSVFADAGTASTSAAFFGRVAAATAAAGTFGVFIMDILDYSNTSKYKTLRCLGGADLNGSGEIRFNSSAWLSTSAITSMAFVITDGGSYTADSSFSLYGIK